jgi:hypothetical protein
MRGLHWHLTWNVFPPLTRAARERIETFIDRYNDGKLDGDTAIDPSGLTFGEMVADLKLEAFIVQEVM